MVYGNGLPGWLSHVEVLSRWVAPPAIVTREIVVWRAEICGRDSYVRPPLAPLWRLCGLAHYLKAGAARSPTVEQRSAQRRIFYTVAICIQISITTSSTCILNQY